MSRKTNNKGNEYFRVMTDTSEPGAADVYLYGYIGQEKWWDDDPTEALTDLAVVKAIKDLEKSYNRINIRINSPGGSVLHGDPIIAAIRSSTADIHTYNDGMAASMAFDIWVSGKNRHASTHSKFMVHATATVAIGTAADMRSAAAMLDKFDETSIASMALATGLDEETIRGEYYDYADHWLTARDAKNLGLVAELEDYQTTAPVQEPEKMSFRQLLSVAHRVAMPQEKDENEFEKEKWREDILSRRILLNQKITVK